jgi:hypothetical protein
MKPTIIEALAAAHPPENGWIFVRELRMGTGYGGGVEQRLDAWAIQCWRQRGVQNLRRAFELKQSAADLVVELKDPDKRWLAKAVSHEFYFVASVGLVNPKLLDADDGLMEWDGAAVRVVVPARVREAMHPRWDFVASLARTLRGMA